MKLQTLFIIYCLIFSFNWTNTAAAIELTENLQLHGYGHIAHISSQKNTFHETEASGSWDNLDVALLFIGTLNKNSKAWTQLYHIHGENRMDWAFVDYTFDNGSTLKFGQIKLPYGFYNETRDLEYPRPSSIKPFLYLDASEMVAEAYRGLAYSFQPRIWGADLSLDLYAGEIVDFENSEEEYQGLYGGRLGYKKPGAPLQIYSSFYSSGLKAVGGETDNIKNISLSVGYEPHKMDIKFEWAYNSVFQEVIETYYFQFAYIYDERWTPYLRHDYITTDTDASSQASFYQRSNVLGLGYRINHFFSLRLEHHFNEGYALPVLTQDVAIGAGEKSWSMSTLSLNFMF